MARVRKGTGRSSGASETTGGAGGSGGSGHGEQGGGRGGKRGRGRPRAKRVPAGRGSSSVEREVPPETRGSVKRVTRQSAEEARRAGKSADLREGLPNDYKERGVKRKSPMTPLLKVKVEKDEEEEKSGHDAGDGGDDEGGEEGGGESAIEIVASQETVFQKAAEDMKSALSDALPGVPVQIIEGTKGSFEIRKKQEEGEAFLHYKDLKRPYRELKDMDAKKLAEDIAKKWEEQP